MIIHGHYINGKCTPTYNSWEAMKKRCSNINDEHYKNYGKRGISFCEAWKDFPNFLKDMGIRPSNKTLGRINNDLGYYKENCEWQTFTQQNRNSRNNNLITFNGITRCIKEWNKN